MLRVETVGADPEQTGVWSDSQDSMTFQVGTELEILAPTGSSRATLAEGVARSIGGSVVEDWHVDSEPSAHPDLEVFHHLTPAFTVFDASGDQYLRLVSDVTIHADLHVKEPSRPGWHRVLSDDQRFLRMVGQFLPAMNASSDDLEALADRFGLTTERKGDTTRLHDSSGASVVMFTTLPGEKERVTECISPPLTEGFDEWLSVVIGTANDLGFTVPTEGATHFHYDAELFRRPDVFQQLVFAFGANVDVIRQKMQTNPHCRRLGALPAGLIELVESDRYATMSWPDVAAAAGAVDGLTKYNDVNVLHLLADAPKHDTVEFRMLPSSLEIDRVRQLRADVDTLVRHLLEPSATRSEVDGR